MFPLFITYNILYVGNGIINVLLQTFIYSNILILSGALGIINILLQTFMYCNILILSGALGMSSMWIKDTFLTEKESKVLEFFIEGKDTEFIAKELDVTRNRVYAILDTLTQKKKRSINTTSRLQEFSYEKRKTKTKGLLRIDSQIRRIMLVGKTAHVLLRNIAKSLSSRPTISSTPLWIGRVQLDDPDDPDNPAVAVIFSVDSEAHPDYGRYSSKMETIIQVTETETKKGLEQSIGEAILTIQ